MSPEHFFLDLDTVGIPHQTWVSRAVNLSHATLNKGEDLVWAELCAGTQLRHGGVGQQIRAKLPHASRF
jgi:hypothetical protein